MAQNIKTGPFKVFWNSLRTIMGFWITSKPQRVRFDVLTIGLISLITIGSTIAITDALTPLNPSFKTKEAEVIRTTPLMDTRELTRASEIGVVKKGEKVEILAYSGYGYYQVETEKGERGWIYLTAFDDELVVDELANDAELEVGTVCRWVKIDPDNNYRIVVRDESGQTHTLARGNVAPTFSFGVPAVKGENSWEKPYIYVTPSWMKKHFKEGVKLDKVMKKYYGNALSIDVRDDGSKMVMFPFHVKEFKYRKEYETVKVLFKDDAFVSYEMSDPDKMKFLERWIPFGQRIVGSRLFIKLRSHSYVIEPQYDDINDVIKGNQEAKDLPMPLRVVVIALLLALCWIILNAHLLFFPALLSLTGRIKSLSNDAYEKIMCYSVLLYMILAYLIFLPYWMIIAVAVVIAFCLGGTISEWILYGRCQGCKEMHTLETVGWSDPEYYEYDEYIQHSTQEVSRSGVRRTISSWTEKRRHRVKVQKEYLKCKACGNDLTITHENDKVV